MAPPPVLSIAAISCFIEFRKIQDTPHVDVESPAILFFGHLIERSPDLDTGIVEGDIETAVRGQDEVDRLLDVHILGDIRANKRCSATGLGNLRGRPPHLPFRDGL
jgi:hypothetical protein